MKRKRKGVIILVAGIIALAAGVGVLVFGAISFVEKFGPVAVMESPGEVEVEIEQPGVYTLWHDHQTVFNGRSVSHPTTLPPGFHFALEREADGAEFRLAPHRAHTTLSTGGRQSVGVGTFEPDRPGAYKLRVRQASGDKRVFSLTEGSFLEGFTEFGLWIAGGGLASLVGLVLLILGIVFIVTASGAKPPPPPVAGLPYS